MSETQNSKHKRRKKALPVLGAAGLSLSLASGAFAAAVSQAKGPASQPASGHEITLNDEEISDVSLATFRILDKENPGALRPHLRLAMGACAGCAGCAGCGGCWGGTYPPWWAANPPPYYDSGAAPPPHRYVHPRRRKRLLPKVDK